MPVKSFSRRERRLLAQVESYALAWHIREIARLCGRVELQPTALLQLLNDRVGEATCTISQWPKSPNQLGRQLNQLREALALKGVEVSFRRQGHLGRLWMIERADLAEKRRHQEAIKKLSAASRSPRRRGERPSFDWITKR